MTHAYAEQHAVDSAQKHRPVLLTVGL